MKKILLSLAVITAGFSANSQVICYVEDPLSIAGNLNFTWASPADGDWSTPDFLLPNTFVKDTLAMVEDGTPGTNDQGNPISQEGCDPLINGVDVDGKIAVVYRNTCEFGTKALNAQNAGAVAVIIINRDPEVIGMLGGSNGASVTIPVIMLSSDDGLKLTNEMANGPVCVFIGNKTGVFADDCGITKGRSLISKSTAVNSVVAQNGTEFNFDLGSRVYNYGNQDQASVSLIANIDGPSGNVYNETVSIGSIVAGDSADVFPTEALNFTQFSLASYPAGRYTLTYTVDLGGTDEYDTDNTVTAEFVVQDSIYAIAHIDATTGLPVQTNGIRPSNNNSTFSNCVVFDNPNGSRVKAEGLYFSALGTNVDLSGEEIALYAYEWQDVFTDLDDAALAFSSLNLLTNGYYYYPSDLQGETVYGAFDAPLVLSDDQRYLFCAQTVNLEVFLGFDNTVDYTQNVDYYLQPLGPIEGDGLYFALGFGSDVAPSVGVRMTNTVGVDENTMIEGTTYPNPAKDIVTIAIETTEGGTLAVTDLAGRVVMSDALSFIGGETTVNIADLTEGVYVFNVTLENGQTSQFSVVKK